MSNPTNALIDELASTKLFIEQKGEIFARSNLGSRAAEALRTQQVEIEQAESLMRAASDDATRLGTENQKLCLDLKCLEESTVDSKIAEAWEDRFHKEVDRSAETRRVLTGQLDELQTRCLEKDQQKLLLGRQIDELKEQHQWHRCEPTQLHSGQRVSSLVTSCCKRINSSALALNFSRNSG